MKTATIMGLCLPLTIILSGCTASGTGTPSTSGQVPNSTASAAVDLRAEGEVEPEVAALRDALRDATEDRSQWESFHLSVGCQGEYGMRSAEVFGNGVGIWDFRRQFTLNQAEISSLLETLNEADFAGLADVSGGRKKPDPRQQSEKPEAVRSLQVICRVELSLSGLTKQAVQLAKGEQSAELRELADALLEICEGPGGAGTAAGDLTEGLEKLSTGDLAPETFQVLLLRRPEKGASEPVGDGFLLRLSGSRAISSLASAPAAGPQDSVSLTLAAAEVADLAGELTRLHLAEMPLNLFAQDYTDLSVEVLDHKKSVQARQFAGMTPVTHGDRQNDFDQIVDLLYRLHLRVMREGKPVREASQSG